MCNKSIDPTTCEIQGLSNDPIIAYDQGRRDGRAETLNAVEICDSTNTQKIKLGIRSLILEFRDLYRGDLSGEAVSLLLTKLEELSHGDS